MTSKARERILIAVVGLTLLGSVGYLLVRAAGGASRLVDRDVLGLGEAGETFDALPWLVVATIAATAVLIGWIRAARRDGDAGDRILQEIQKLHRVHEQRRRQSRELNTKLSDLHRREGALGSRDDVRSLVLLAAISLLNADKGLLLSRRDDDDDGNLDVVVHEGFESDPEESALVQRFGGEVIERDKIVRIGRHEMPGDHACAADDEIDNLVAIPIYIADEFHGVVICANGEAIEHDDEVLVALGDHAGAILENSRLHGEIRGSYLATVRMLADALEVKDPFLRGHSDQVSGLVRAVAKRLDLTEERREQLVFASLLHDIGKIGVSERILLKPGPLTDEEYGAVKLHPRIGYRLVAQVPLLEPIAPAILHHHERWDGGGYPTGLAGERIPVEARVIAIIDAYSAMISDRPYKEAMPVEVALEELERCAGTHFDPTLVAIFVEEVRSGITAEASPGLTLAEALDDPELNLARGIERGAFGLGRFSSTDSLTLLDSHSYFHERLEAEISRVALAASGTDELALIMIELTNLSDLNRELGYAEADRLLVQLASDVERAAADRGGFAGREGGSRLALLVPGLGSVEAEELAALLGDRAPEGTVLSTGAASWVEGDTAESMIEAAGNQLVPD